MLAIGAGTYLQIGGRRTPIIIVIDQPNDDIPVFLLTANLNLLSYLDLGAGFDVGTSGNSYCSSPEKVRR